MACVIVPLADGPASFIRMTDTDNRFGQHGRFYNAVLDQAGQGAVVRE